MSAVGFPTHDAKVAPSAQKLTPMGPERVHVSRDGSENVLEPIQTNYRLLDYSSSIHCKMLGHFFHGNLNKSFIRQKCTYIMLAQVEIDPYGHLCTLDHWFKVKGNTKISNVTIYFCKEPNFFKNLFK